MSTETISDNTAIYLCDMSRCEPASALSTQQNKSKWLLTDYETEDGLKGVMMYADSRQSPPPVTLPLNVSGWHKLYIGINYTRTVLGDGAHLTPWTMWGSLRAKLSRDTGNHRIAMEQIWRHAIGHYQEKMSKPHTSIYEVYWRSADLTGQALELATPLHGPDNEDAITNVSWIKMVPMSDEEIDRDGEDQPTLQTKRLAGAYCLGQMSGHTYGNVMYHPTDPGYIEEMIEPFRDSDFKMLLWECIRGDICVFNTRIGRVGWIGEQWNPEWIDPLEIAVKHAHDCGIDLYISKRMIGPGFPFKHSPLQQNEYYYKNKQFALKDEDGRDTSILSLAYPNIREHWVSLLREAVRYGADGVHLNLHRTNPFCLYEDPVVEPFMAVHGIDPRTLPFDDERWLRHRASFVTQYVREVRQMLNEEGQSLDKRLGLAITFWRDPYPLYYATDVETWIKEGLIDYAMPQWIHLATDDGPKIVADLKKMTEGTNTQLWPDIFPRTPHAEDYAQKLKQMYDAGADGFAFWSIELRTPRASEWAVLKRMGHYDTMDRYKKLAPTLWRNIPLRELGGISTHHSHTDG